MINTTYFGIKYGLMVFIDYTTKTVLHYRVIQHETNALYKLGIEYIKSQGIDIKSITCDIR